MADRIRRAWDLEGSRGISAPDYGVSEAQQWTEIENRRKRGEQDYLLAKLRNSQQQGNSQAQLAGTNELARMRESGVNRRFDVTEARFSDRDRLDREMDASTRTRDDSRYDTEKAESLRRFDIQEGRHGRTDALALEEMQGRNASRAAAEADRSAASSDRRETAKSAEAYRREQRANRASDKKSAAAAKTKAAELKAEEKKKAASLARSKGEFADTEKLTAALDQLLRNASNPGDEDVRQALDDLYQAAKRTDDFRNKNTGGEGTPLQDHFRKTLEKYREKFPGKWFLPEDAPDPFGHQSDESRFNEQLKKHGMEPGAGSKWADPKEKLPSADRPGTRANAIKRAEAYKKERAHAEKRFYEVDQKEIDGGRQPGDPYKQAERFRVFMEGWEQRRAERQESMDSPGGKQPMLDSLPRGSGDDRGHSSAPPGMLDQLMGPQAAAMGMQGGPQMPIPPMDAMERLAILMGRGAQNVMGTGRAMLPESQIDEQGWGARTERSMDAYDSLPPQVVEMLRALGAFR